MKFIRVLILVFFAFSFLFLVAPIYAQVPPPYVPCNKTDDPEFHSLRPYQASATCLSTTADYAKFCGNTLTLQETITKTYVPGDPNCKTVGNKIVCSYTVPVPSHKITVDLSNANLPIMGNTEEVINYKNQEDDLNYKSDAVKVNEYISWYLNGIVNKKEYPEKTDSTSVVNYSGPIAKLLPQEIQLAKRVETVENATGKDLGSNQKDIQQNRHDQVAVCTPLLSGKPENCGFFSQKYRLSFWTGKILFNEYINFFIELIVKLVPGMERSVIGELLRNQEPWIYKYPPLSWNFDSSLKYRKAYNEWQGKVCIIVPVINILVCADNPFVPDKYADLFPYIPLSSTEDLEGNIKVDSTSSASGAGVTNITFNNQAPATLFFSHIQESDELGSILQDTYISKDQENEKSGADTAVAPASSCNTVDVRSNKGDNLFAKSLSGDLGYTASFTCDFNPPSCNTKVGNYCNKLLGTCVQPDSDWTCMIPLGQKDCPSGYTCKLGCFCNPPTQTCSKTVSIALSTSSNTPKIDDVWSRLVAGPTAIVKRMFPKLGTQIGTLKDIPGSTHITYSGAQASSAELNLPHLGGISEYFLKGIQTLLRPKGYGETISFGPNSPTPNPSTDICGVASKYHIPCCQLKGVEEIETGSGTYMGSDTCSTKNGVFSCCHGGVCGPAQVACGQYNAFVGNDNIDMCTTAGSAELLARAMLLKLCQADLMLGKISGVCTSYDWVIWGNYVLQHYSVSDGDYTATAYFYGLAHGCIVSACSQFRWGAGKGYCDSVKSYCDTGSILPDATDKRFCEKCNEELIRAGQQPMDCSKY